MYQALPYKRGNTTTSFPTSPPLNSLTSSSVTTVLKGRESLESLVDENAVIIFGRRGCCMTHVVRRLLLGLGVNAAVYEVDAQHEQSVADQLKRLGPAPTADGGTHGCTMSFPTVFIGGRWFGDLDKVMATHITGELTLVLKDAGALWL